MMGGDGGPVPADRRAWQAGRAAFGPTWRPAMRATTPGRIELLGNHLDYNGGPVLAAAIDRYMVVLTADAGDRGVSAVAADIGDQSLASLDPATLVDWHNAAASPAPFDYARGVIAGILARPGLGLRAPCQLAFAGDVPIGYGLSSSAALCVGLALALTMEPPPAKELILLAQEAEHRAGTPCGTMDQAASITGGVIRYQDPPLTIERLSPDLGDLVFAVADSGVERSLGASSYPRRVAESRRALDIALRALGASLPALASMTRDQFAALERLPEGEFPQPLRKRTRHVVTETERVNDGITAMRAGDWSTFGRLMTASGRSSATDYDISHPRVEELVAATLVVNGVLGARMMGGGEGGSILVLLPRPLVPKLDAALRRGYYARYRMDDRQNMIQTCRFAEGARIGAMHGAAG